MIDDKTSLTRGRVALWSDGVRIFLTCLLVYAVFWNPWVQAAMTWNFLDAAVSFVDTGRWEMVHAPFYRGVDTATVKGRLVSGEPPGMTVLIVPFYVVWRAIMGPTNSPESFQGLNGFLALAIGNTSAALVAVQVAWLAGWLGAGRRTGLLTAVLVAFGTENFFLGTVLFKESPAALAAITAFRFAVGPGGAWKRTVAGIIAGMATTVAHPCGLLALLLLGLVMVRHGKGHAAAFLAGLLPLVLALGAYNLWLFGKPWLSGYLVLTDMSDLGFVSPKPLVLLDLVAGLPGGLFLYAPFLLLALTGVRLAWQTDRRGEAIVIMLFLVGLWIAAASWQSQFSERASWGHSLGPRMMFPGIPLFAAFAALSFERTSRLAVLLLAIPSLACGYLSAQAGFIPCTPNLLTYAIKTWLSGTGMGVLFKEALPMWMGFETIHTRVSLSIVTYNDLLSILPTSEGLLLLRNQAVMLFTNLAVLCLVGLTMRSLWRDAAFSEKRDDAGMAFSPSRTQR